MKKYLIVGDKSTVPDEVARIDSFKSYLSETLGDSAQVDSLLYDEIVFGIAPGSYTAKAVEKDIDLSDYHAIYLRGRRSDEYFLARFCNFNGIPCINDYSNYYQSNKLAQTTVFLEAGVVFLATYYCADQDRLAAFAEATLGYPYILKANKASHGDSNYLIRTPEDAQKARTAEPNVDFIVQEFCPNECDYRLLLVGDKTLLFERRGGADTHLNNTSKGGVATNLDIATLPEHIVAQAKLLAQMLGLKIAGFDIIPKLGTGELYFLEINYQPQLRTGALVEDKQALLRELFESF